MITFYYRTILTLVLTFSLFIGAAASQPTFKIVDQNNQPLANAVIEITSTKQTHTDTTHKPIYIMDQIDKSFVPSVLVIPKSSLVSFPNSDEIRHHVYSFSPTKAFELKLYAGKSKDPLPFEQAGVVVLGCNIHDSMVGYIYVAEHNQVYMSDEKGLIKIPDAINQIEQLNLWHPLAAAGVEYRQSYKNEQLIINDGVITFIVEISEPSPRDSFENLISYD